MIPDIVIFGKVFGIYMIMALVGVFVMGIYLCWQSRRRGIDDNDTIATLLFAAIGVLAGGHLLYGLTNFSQIVKVFSDLSIIGSFQDFIDVAVSIFGGSVFYGGLLGGLLAGSIYLKKTKKDVGVFANLIAPGIPLFHFFGRIGCFLGGCCYGLECSVGFTYHHSQAPGANDVVRFPIQLVEAGLNLALFFILHRLGKQEKFANKLLHIYLISYAIIRFVDEFFRGDVYRGILWGLSTSQWISLGIFVVAVVDLGRRLAMNDV